MSLQTQDGSTLPQLVEIMQRLLGKDGCPWDREQTLESLRRYTIEEAYEVVDAIDQRNPKAHVEELGDLLLQIVFQAELARAQGWFGPDDVVQAISTKMIRRHPHVFGDEAQKQNAKTSGQVLAQWEQLKQDERKTEAGNSAEGSKPKKRMMDGLPKSMPALLQATRVSEKAAHVGFDWPDLQGARAKIDEELAELDRELAPRQGEPNPSRMEAELGDLLFAIVNVARRSNIDPERALLGTVEKFKRRFANVEDMVEASAKPWSAFTLAELDVAWNAAKAGELVRRDEP